MPSFMLRKVERMVRAAASAVRRSRETRSTLSRKALKASSSRTSSVSVPLYVGASTSRRPSASAFIPLDSETMPRDTRMTERMEKIAMTSTSSAATATMTSRRLRALEVETRSSLRPRATASLCVSVACERSRDTVCNRATAARMANISRRYWVCASKTRS
ncbi:hypothetical protein D9M72_513080 [compost metagenome]